MSGDYISREAAIIGLAASSLTPPQIDDAAEALQLVPAADVVEVRHGRWEQVGSIIPMYECDQCHAFALGGNFCPSCGAKMDGGQEA